MSAYFILALDTQGPAAEIVSPGFVDMEEEFTITVNSDETLKAAYIHELYLIDSLGTRFDLSYSLNTHSLVSTLSLNSLGASSGSLTIYALIYDEVLNPSEVVSKELSTEIPLIINIVSLEAEIKKELSLNASLEKEKDLNSSIIKTISLQGRIGGDQ
ncbi:MAG TPA: hypothetical protein VKN64_07700 [Halanaerobiales bacterium]|nr:hypothetical protein [Halanaerobiales bacterium]